MPQQLDTIQQEIEYILNYWVQNSNSSITGTIGQNVVWNLANFIKNLPENFRGATIVSQPQINYTASPDDCIIIFNNNSRGGLDFNPNRWNKYVIVNQTDNVRYLLNNKRYIDINGVGKTAIPARVTVTIVKGVDDLWYQVSSGGGTGGAVEIIGIAGRGRDYDPATNSSVYQYAGLVNKGGSDGFYDIYVNSVRMQNYGSNPNFVVTDPSVGLIDISPLFFEAGDSISFNI